MVLGLLITLSGSLIIQMAALKYYVTPNKTLHCADNQFTCLTLQEYANQPDIYFTSDTIFYFEPGRHMLKSSLNFVNAHNFTFQGLSDSKVPNVMFDSLVSITWDGCSNIKVSSIVFTLLSDFTLSIIFRKTYLVQLSAVTIVGYSWNIGCSAIMSHQSSVDIRDSKFIGIQGLFGAALMISASNVTITKNNMSIGNTATAGGSIFLYDSTLMLNGTNRFINNTSRGRSQVRGLDSMCNYTISNYMYYLGGGAIICVKSTLMINEYSSFTRNTATSLSDGGAISAQVGTISICGSISFHSNHAYHSGAMILDGVSLKLCGNLSLVNNCALVDGGALYIYDTSIIFEGNCTLSVPSCTSTPTTPVIFRQNKAKIVGGAISTGGNDNIIVFSSGYVIFFANSARNGGAIGSREVLCIKMILYQSSIFPLL